VVENGYSNLIQEYPVDQLTAPNPTPSISINMGGTFNYPTGAAFDRNGTLWVTQDGTFRGVTGYPNAELMDGGNNAPAIQLTSPAWANPLGLAFDNAGNMWVVDPTNATDTLTQIPASQLAASGAVSPLNAIPISGAQWSWAGLAFFPAPTGLPIFQ
jgi:secreted PhoX family phosphatase